MADDNYRRLQCADCRLPFACESNRGRPRIRCLDCSPAKIAAPGTYSAPSRLERCANPRCAKQFQTTFKLQTHCSSACQVSARNRASQERRRDRSPRKCGHCGDVFAPAYGEMRQLYCGPRCAASSKNESGNTYYRRARRYGVQYVFFNKKSVFRRDGWKCQICGVDTPERLQGKRAPNAPTLDHIVAMSNGGAHVPSNTQTACWRCNNRKADGPPKGQIGLFA